MLPPERETVEELRRRPHGAVRVLVAGATSASGSADVAAMLTTALTMAGLRNDSVHVVHAGAMLDGLHSASAAGAKRFVVVTGGGAAALASAFAMVKAIETRHPGARIEVLVTRQDESRAHASYLRVRSASERFLGREVGFAGAFPDLDAGPVGECDAADPTTRRATRASRAARIWAARLLAECSEEAWPEAAHSMD